MRQLSKNNLRLFLTLILILTASACGRGDDPAINTTGTVSPRATPTAGETQDDQGTGSSLNIDAPEDGARLSGTSVEVRITASDFQVVGKLGQPAAPGEGHVHFYRDVDTVPTEQGKPAVTAKGTYHATATTSHTWTDVGPGEHTFSAQLVNNDHTPLSPPVFKTVRVTTG